jgi:hypothetical protein
LVYGSEAILPIYVVWESPPVEQHDENVVDDNRQVDIDNLEEARCAALVQSIGYLEGIRRYHDRNVKKRSFNVGDLVLCCIQNTEGLHKLNSPWEGPFSISKVTSQGSYRLETRGTSTNCVGSTRSLSITHRSVCSIRALFFDTVFVGEDFILVVTHVFTRIRSGAAGVVAAVHTDRSTVAVTTTDGDLSIL